MGRWGGYGKDCIEDRKSIRISNIRKRGYLRDGARISGSIRWTRGEEESGSMSVMSYEDNDALKFSFTATLNDGEKKPYSYDINLTKTPCNYGGYRYWFVCPGCGKKYGTLHLGRNFVFGCRKCLNLCYRSQNESTLTRSFNKLYPRHHDAEELYKTIKYPYRNGKPTRKYKKYRKLMLAHVPREEQLAIMRKMYSNRNLYGDLVDRIK